MRFWGIFLSRLRPSTGGIHLGRRGERRAARFLRRRGYRIVDRNVRTHLGEIDILALTPDRRTLVVVEVKTGGGGPLPPEIRVHRGKQRKLTHLAVQARRRYRLDRLGLRFDVIGVDLPDGGKPVLRHHIGAFESVV